MLGPLSPLNRFRTFGASRGWLALCTNQRACSHSSREIGTTLLSCYSMASWNPLPWQGNLTKMESLPTLAELQELLQSATAAVQSYQHSYPDVQNLTKLINRIQSDLSFIKRQRKLLQQQGCEPEAQNRANSCLGGLGQGRLQGIVNNLRGFHGELLALHEAPGVVAVCQRFRAAPTKLWAPACSMPKKTAMKPDDGTSGAIGAAGKASTANKKQPQARIHTNSRGAATEGGSEMQATDLCGTSSSSSMMSGSSPASVSDAISSHDLPRRQQVTTIASGVQGTHTAALPGYSPAGGSSTAGDQPAGGCAPGPADVKWVEVDVVANEGLTWIEVKNQELFGVESIHWVGSPGHGKGLAQQIRDLQAVAAAPVNSRRWRAPEIVVFFPSAVDAGVAAALGDMGVRVAVGPGSLSSLPVPQPPSTTNLDVTSLCALVSEVSWGDPHGQQLREWASNTVHWRDCLAAQICSPLLSELQACLDNSQQLVTSCLAVQQFQKLVDMFAGPREQHRWLKLQQRVLVYHFNSDLNGDSRRCAACGSHFRSAASILPSAGVHSQSEAVMCNKVVNMEQVAVVQKLSSGIEQEGWDIAERQLPELTYSASQRICCVDKLTRQQRAVLGLGDALQALTLTANGSAVRCCEHYGVKLEAVVHRPVWLTGI